MAALAGAVVSSLSVAHAGIVSITDNPPVNITGTAGTDYLVYQQINSTTLAVNNSASVLSVLSGMKSQSAPGGNVRLFASSDGTPLATFATSPHTVLSGTLNGQSIAISSLNGDDFFTTPTGYNTSFGANNLAMTWFDSFLANYNFSAALVAGGYGSQIATQEAILYNGFLTYNGSGAGGFQRLSGPSISYVQEDTTTNQAMIGLADTDGFLEPLILAYVDKYAPNILPYVPSDVYASKLVGVSFNGGPAAYYWSFSQQSSGVSTSDGTDSDNLEFQITAPAPVPEPASMGLVLAAGVVALSRRKRPVSPPADVPLDSAGG
jgi:hypothetical protein